MALASILPHGEKLVNLLRRRGWIKESNQINRHNLFCSGFLSYLLLLHSLTYKAAISFSGLIKGCMRFIVWFMYSICELNLIQEAYLNVNSLIFVFSALNVHNFRCVSVCVSYVTFRGTSYKWDIKFICPQRHTHEHSHTNTERERGRERALQGDLSGCSC